MRRNVRRNRGQLARAHGRLPEPGKTLVRALEPSCSLPFGMDLVVHKPEIAHFHAATLRIKAETGVADKSLQQFRAETS